MSRASSTPRSRGKSRPGGFSPVVLVLSLLLLFGAAAIGIRAAQANPSAPGSTAAGLSIGTPAYRGPLGIPAIQPRANLTQASGPHFTETDVRQYVSTHRPGFTVPGTPNPTVVSVQFLTAAQVSAKLQGEAMGVPDSTPLCLVYVSGTFRNTYVPMGATAQEFTEGVMVFDAHTGNLLISSVG